MVKFIFKAKKINPKIIKISIRKTVTALAVDEKYPILF